MKPREERFIGDVEEMQAILDLWKKQSEEKPSEEKQETPPEENKTKSLRDKYKKKRM